MGQLTELPNVSKVTEGRLNKAKIETKEQLIQVGSREAFIRILSFDSGACLNLLYGLEGAIQGIRWHGLSESTKSDLKEFFNEIKK